MNRLEAEFLDEHFGRLPPTQAKVIDNTEVSKIEGSRLPTVPRIMRNRLRDTTCRYSAQWATGRIDLYYSYDHLIPNALEFVDVDHPSHKRLLELLAESFRLISEGLKKEGNTDDVSLTFLRDVESSQYLKIILGKLKSSVIEHLRERHSAFSEASDFLVQYFIAFQDEEDHKGLRYFPLEEESRKLEDANDVDAIVAELHASGDRLPNEANVRQFITKYDWISTSSFVAYVQESRCALYLKDWKEEPLVKEPAVETAEQRRDRRIATVIMQHFRGNTPDQFIVPFFYEGTVFGLMLLNCQHTIAPEHRLLLIRSARDVAPQVYLAIATDELVNHVEQEKRKAAQVRAYRYAVNAMLHEEARFCQKILKHLEGQSDEDPKVAQLLFMADEKQQAVREYRGSNAPLTRVEDEALYPSTNVSVNVLHEYAEWINAIYNPANEIRLKFAIGSRLSTCGAIPNFEGLIIARVMINLVKNSLNASQDIPELGRSAQLLLSVDLVSENNAEFVEISARDNCGGFELEELVAWRMLTAQGCIDYLNRKEEAGKRDSSASGMGLLIIAKYIDSTGGEGGVRNVQDRDSDRVGAEVYVKLKLRGIDV
jgi:signal transduction histidine kinase